MASKYDANVPWMVPGSPSKTTLQRGNATRDSSPRKGDRAQQEDRMRQIASPPAGKENFPIATESRGRAETKSGKMSFFRALSPERRGNTEAKGRSVSPTKRNKKESDHQKDNSHTLSRSSGEIDSDFSNMLHEMEVPATLRQKLITLEPKVKESMMKGQATLNLGMLSSSSSGKVRPPISDQFRKSKSSGGFSNEGGWEDLELMVAPDLGAIFGVREPRSASGMSSQSSSSTESKETRKGSLLSPPLSSSSPFAPGSAPRSRSGSFSSLGFSASSSSGATAASFATLLKTTDSSRLDVAQVKRMRAALSSESPTWIGEFVEEGGYTAMVTRLKELLALEWREEQHDDQLLHELLRCFVALSTTDRGRTTLQSMTPTPFVELAALLFSEKRPGDLSTRKLLVELLTLLPDLPSSGTESKWQAVREERESSTVSSAVQSSSGNFALLVTLLHNLRDPTHEAKVDFIKASHAPRPFKSFVTELLNINRDYFWVFCHSNRYWALQDINVDEVECPKVPGGMTGGVEFEAMAYLTSLFRLLNTACSRILHLARQRKDRSIAFDFHSLLLSSGIDRTLGATRKASQVYYQPLHLELARYFDNAHQSGFQMPAELEAWQSTPRLMQTTEYHYFEQREAARPSSSRSASPEKGAVKQIHSSTATSSSSPKKSDPLSEERAANGTGKWLGGNKRSSRDQGGMQVKEMEMGPRLPDPRLDSDQVESREGQSKGQVPRGSTVNTAVQRWEQLTAKNQGGLGIGWAPPR